MENEGEQKEKRNRGKENFFANGMLVIKFQAKSAVYYALSKICMNSFCMSRHSVYIGDITHNLPEKKKQKEKKNSNFTNCYDVNIEKCLCLSVILYTHFKLHIFHCNLKP